MPDPATRQMTAIVRMMTGMAMGEGLIGVDLCDLRSVLRDSGTETARAAYGVGEASGPCGSGRAIAAARLAIADLQRNLAAGKWDATEAWTDTTNI
jgi:cell division GTPase FtsZ